MIYSLYLVIPVSSQAFEASILVWSSSEIDDIMGIPVFLELLLLESSREYWASLGALGMLDIFVLLRSDPFLLPFPPLSLRLLLSVLLSFKIISDYNWSWDDYTVYLGISFDCFVGIKGFLWSFISVFLVISTDYGLSVEGPHRSSSETTGRGGYRISTSLFSTSYFKVGLSFSEISMFNDLIGISDGLRLVDSNGAPILILAFDFGLTNLVCGNYVTENLEAVFAGIMPNPANYGAIVALFFAF